MVKMRARSCELHLKLPRTPSPNTHARSDELIPRPDDKGRCWDPLRMRATDDVGAVDGAAIP